eukprot:scpid69615/ scgid0795/ POC1 centriolar protein homolog B; WD repeat domain 51B
MCFPPLCHITPAHTGPATCVSFHPSGNYLISSSNDSMLKVVDLLEGRLFYTLHGHQDAALSATFSPSGQHFCSTGADGKVLLWRTNFDAVDYNDLLQSRPRRDFSSSKSSQRPAASARQQPPSSLPTSLPSSIPPTKTTSSMMSSMPGRSSADSAGGLEPSARDTHVVAGHDPVNTVDPSPPVVDVGRALFSMPKKDYAIGERDPATTSVPLQASFQASGSTSTMAGTAASTQRGGGKQQGQQRSHSHPPKSVRQAAQQSAAAQQQHQVNSHGHQPSQVTVPLEAHTMPTQLTNALEHITTQLDMITQTVSIIEQRLTLAENKLKECLDNQQKITLQIKPQ